MKLVVQSKMTYREEPNTDSGCCPFHCEDTSACSGETGAVASGSGITNNTARIPVRSVEAVRELDCPGVLSSTRSRMCTSVFPRQDIEQARKTEINSPIQSVKSILVCRVHVYVLHDINFT